MAGEYNLWTNIIQYGLEFMGLHYSTYRAFVVDNEDPEGLGRLQLRIPQMNELADDSTWAWPKGQHGSKGNGIQMLPQKGDMVWVEFEFGNPDYPIWSYAGYAEDEKPIEFKTVRHYGFKTPNGTTILINDNKGEEEVLVRLNSNSDYIKINKDIIELESPLIKNGKGGDEQGVLGNTLEDKLDQILTQIDKLHTALLNHTHTSNSGPTGTPINYISIEQTKDALNDIKSSIPDILSKKVKIDK